MKRWALAGGALGAVLALLVFAPAAWLAGMVASASGEHVQLADARGTVWQGSAVLVLTGGAGSRDASALPGRLQWRLGLGGGGLALRATQACCLNGELLLHVVPGLGRLRVELPGAQSPSGGPSDIALGNPSGRALGTRSGNPPGSPALATAIGQWPASWLVGLGTPWNTLQPSGTLALSSPGLMLEQVQGRWRFSGRAELTLAGLASRLSTLDTLGSYRLTLSGDAARGDATSVQLGTSSGALQLSGSGVWAGAKLRFTGQASAAPGSEAGLNNLLNIIGRRQGALSVISIG